MSDPQITKQEPSERQIMLSVLGTMGVILMFVFILIIAYLPNRPAPVDTARVKERKATRAKVEAKQRDSITTYSWIDQPKGIVRIPVERAMELVVKELSLQQAEPARQ